MCNDSRMYVGLLGLEIQIICIKALCFYLAGRQCLLDSAVSPITTRNRTQSGSSGTNRLTHDNTPHPTRMDIAQQTLAVDTKFNKYRATVQARQIYLRRRAELLGRQQVREEGREEGRKESGYLQIRTQLLRHHVRSLGQPDLQSTKSFSVRSGESRTRLGRLVPPATTSQVSSEAYDFRGFHHLSDLHRGGVTHLMFAHNSSSCLLASSLDGLLSVHRLETSPPTVTRLTGHQAGITDFDISTNNELVVSASLDNMVCLWQLSTAVMIRQMTSSGRAGLTSARFLPGNNNLVVAASRDGLVQIINISTGIFPTSGTTSLPGSVLCLAVSSQV